MPPDLPREILGNIVDYLADSQHSLQSCSLVSSPFRFLSQKHLFASATITLALEPSDPRTTGLTDFLSSTPHIAGCVRSLVIKVETSTSSPHSLNLKAGTEFETLLQLPRLRNLILRSKMGADWPLLSPDSRFKLVSLLHQPSVSRFSLEKIQRFPIQMLPFCPQLQHLSFNISSFDAIHSEPIPAIIDGSEGRRGRAKHGYLKSLTLDKDTPTNVLMGSLTAPDSHLSISHLRRLSSVVSNDHNSALILQKLIDLCSDTLEEIKFEVGGGPFSIPQTIDLKGLHNLRRLEIELLGQTVSYLNHIYPTLPPSNGIVELRISVNPGLTGTGGSTKAWRELDDLLIETCQGSCLERVTVRTMSAWLISPHGFIAQALPKLFSRGILYIEDRYGSAFKGFGV